MPASARFSKIAPLLLTARFSAPGFERCCQPAIGRQRQVPAWLVPMSVALKIATKSPASSVLGLLPRKLDSRDQPAVGVHRHVPFTPRSNVANRASLLETTRDLSGFWSVSFCQPAK